MVDPTGVGRGKRELATFFGRAVFRLGRMSNARLLPSWGQAALIGCKGNIVPSREPEVTWVSFFASVKAPNFVAFFGGQRWSVHDSKAQARCTSQAKPLLEWGGRPPHGIDELSTLAILFTVGSGTGLPADIPPIIILRSALLPKALKLENGSSNL